MTDLFTECVSLYLFFFQAEDGIRDLVRSRGLGDVYKRQAKDPARNATDLYQAHDHYLMDELLTDEHKLIRDTCLLYTSDAADERSSVDLGGRRIIKKKNKRFTQEHQAQHKKNQGDHKHNITVTVYTRSANSHIDM